MTTTSYPRIAILGAGPSGLTLARLLHLSNIPFSLFEGDLSSSARTQGATLDLHTNTGLAAIKACQLWDEFTAEARYDGEATAFVDKGYRIYLQRGGSTEDVLIKSLPEGTIQWGHHVKTVHEDGTIEFAASIGTAGPFDLVIGADGAWSKVRPLLTNDRPFHSGTGGFGFTISSPSSNYPDLYKQVNRGSLFAFSDGKGLQPQELGNGDIYLHAFSWRDEDWQGKLGFDASKDMGKVREHLGELYKDWHPQLRKYTQVGNPEMEIRPMNLYMLPPGNTWTHKQGFTMLGDAAHLMTPFAGEGVNLAMKDALELAEAINTACKDEAANESSQPSEPQANSNAEQADVLDRLDRNIALFEQGMFARAKPIQEHTLANMHFLFDRTPNALEKVLDYLMKSAPAQVREKIQEGIKAKRYGP